MDTSSIEFIATKFVALLKPTLSQRGGIKLGSLRIPPEKSFTKLTGSLQPKDKEELFDQMGKGFLQFHSDEGNCQLHDAIVHALQQVAPKADPAGLYFNDSIDCPLSKLKLITNVKKLKKSVLFDPQNDAAYEYDYDHITEHLARVLGKEELGKWLHTNADQCLFKYNPTSKTRIGKDDLGHKTFNMWKDAAWRAGWVPDSNATLPPEVDEFLNFLVETPEDRKAVMAWLRDCTFGKAEPILILCGVPGVGKNVFVNNLAGGLVGEHNRREATRNFQNSAFHSNIANCRLFLLDEAPLDPKSRETLKAYHNGTAAIERKGIDVGDPETIYASFVLANNHWQQIKLQYPDRKFYTPILRKQNLKEVWTQEKIDNFLDLLTQDDYLRQIASYLKFNFKSGQAKKFPKNKFFEQVCLNSSPPFFRAFHHMCLHKERFTNREFDRGKRVKLDPFMLKDEVDIYEAERGKPLAELEILPDGGWVAVSKVYDGKTKHSVGSASGIIKGV